MKLNRRGLFKTLFGGAAVAAPPLSKPSVIDSPIKIKILSSRDLDSSFSSNRTLKIGDTIQIKRPVRFRTKMIIHNIPSGIAVGGLPSGKTYIIMIPHEDMLLPKHEFDKRYLDPISNSEDSIRKTTLRFISS